MKNYTLAIMGLLLLLNTSVHAEPISNCEYYWTKPNVCKSAFDLPGFFDIQEKQKGNIEQLLHYQYDFNEAYSLGVQTSVKNFHKRGRDFGIGKKLSNSQLTLTVKNPGVNWIGNFKGTEINLHVGENDKEKPTIFIGLFRAW